MNKLFHYCLLFSFYCSNICSEQLFYNAKFKNIGAGEAKIELIKEPVDSTTRAIHFTLRTRKFVDMFYKLRENIYIHADMNDYSLKYLDKRSTQGDYNKTHKAHFDYEKYLVIYQEDSLKIDKKVYDPLGIIYYLRNQNLKMNQSFQFDIYSHGKIKQITMNVIDEEVVTIGSTKYDCFILAPNTLDKTAVLKNKGEIKLWISKDDKKLPVIIEEKANYGIISLRLKNIVY